VHRLADGGSEGDSEDSGDKSGLDDDGSSTAERTVTVVSVLVFSFAAWQAVTVAEGPPRTHVAEMTPTEDGVRAAVVVTNPPDEGLAQVTARVQCGEPSTEVTFSTVPPGDERRAHVRCANDARRST